jgi:hypothetical protein
VGARPRGDPRDFLAWALRDGSWKQVSSHLGHWELDSMDNDRTETNDLAQAEPDRVKRMDKLWDSTVARVGVRPDLKPIWDGVAR